MSDKYFVKATMLNETVQVTGPLSEQAAEGLAMALATTVYSNDNLPRYSKIEIVWDKKEKE